MSECRRQLIRFRDEFHLYLWVAQRRVSIVHCYRFIGKSSLISLVVRGLIN